MYEIIDCHAHIFPPLGEACGHADAETHRNYLQWAMHTHGNQPIRRLRDHQIVTERHLWDPDAINWSGRRQDVDFQVGRFGRFEWTAGGERYYVQFLPPNLQDMHSPPEFMVTQMDYAGIQSAVLQNDHIYGDLAAYFSEAVQRFPGRFIGLVNVDESRAYHDDQLQRLEEGVGPLGLKGLYFTMGGFLNNGFAEYWDEPAFKPFWDRIAALGLSVHWVFSGSNPRGTFMVELHRLRAWYDRYPDVPSVMVHGWPTSAYVENEGKDSIVWPEVVKELMTNHPVFTEVLYPIMWGGKMDYPLARAHHHIKQLYEQFGAERLMWGSDMPNVERYLTYRQALTYISEHSPYIAEADKPGLFGGNIRKVLKMPSDPAGG